ncbi:MAG TPA: hypothetical protein DDY86_05555 [Syntrophaceae bacterium]|nr:hypothetical protein [Syntrophaceae bacterium]
MARILTKLINVDIDYAYSQIHEPFVVQLDELKKAGLADTITIPAGFVHDYESVPLFKGTSKTGGVVHDYLCRADSVPLVTKKLAADCYFEVMESSDQTKATGKLQLARFWLRRWAKYVVVVVAPGYFHKHKVLATYEEMAG